MHLQLPFPSKSRGDREWAIMQLSSCPRSRACAFLGVEQHRPSRRERLLGQQWHPRTQGNGERARAAVQPRFCFSHRTRLNSDKFKSDLRTFGSTNQPAARSARKVKPRRRGSRWGQLAWRARGDVSTKSCPSIRRHGHWFPAESSYLAHQNAARERQEPPHLAGLTPRRFSSGWTGVKALAYGKAGAFSDMGTESKTRPFGEVLVMSALVQACDWLCCLLDHLRQLLAGINMRVFTVAAGILRICANSSTEFS